MTTVDKICKHFDTIGQMDAIAVANVLRDHDAEQQAEIDRLKADRQSLLCATEKTGELVMGLGKQIANQQAEIERLRELCDDAEHWLAVPPTTRSDHDNVNVLCEKLREAAEVERFCPRCGEPDCNDPDSKSCSDNCIMTHQAKIVEQQAEIERLRTELADAQYGRSWLWHFKSRTMAYAEFLERMSVMRVAEQQAAEGRET